MPRVCEAARAVQPEPLGETEVAARLERLRRSLPEAVAARVAEWAQRLAAQASAGGACAPVARRRVPARPRAGDWLAPDDLRHLAGAILADALRVAATADPRRLCGPGASARRLLLARVAPWAGRRRTLLAVLELDVRAAKAALRRHLARPVRSKRRLAVRLDEVLGRPERPVRGSGCQGRPGDGSVVRSEPPC